MAVDLGLDRVGAGQSRFLGHQRGGGAEREAGDIPQRLEHGRAHPPLGHQALKRSRCRSSCAAMRAISLASGQFGRSTASWPA